MSVTDDINDLSVLNAMFVAQQCRHIDGYSRTGFTTYGLVKSNTELHMMVESAMRIICEVESDEPQG